MKEDRRLIISLVVESFCPLFILLFVRHASYCHLDLVSRFFSMLFHGDLSVIPRAIKNPAFGDVFLSILCIIWFLLTVVVAIGFKQLRNSNPRSLGDRIIIESETKESGISFFVSFILPLLVDDVSTLRGLAFFLIILSMEFFLLIRSGLFYQNPVLAALGYKTFVFRFESASQDNHLKRCIGLCKGILPTDEAVIKWRYIADDVYIIANEQGTAD